MGLLLLLRLSLMILRLMGYRLCEVASPISTHPLAGVIGGTHAYAFRPFVGGSCREYRFRLR